MTKNIDSLAKALGATVVGTVPDYSAGAFGVGLLAKTLRDRLEPSHGLRPGRPSDPRWTRRPKVPMATETEQRLRKLAELLSDEERSVSPMQVAAQLLEEATASYFRRSPQKSRRD